MYVHVYGCMYYTKISCILNYALYVCVNVLYSMYMQVCERIHMCMYIMCVYDNEHRQA